MTVYVFPGQGSQVVGMGAELFDTSPILVEQTDMILGYSIKTLCVEDPHQQLNQTQYTQPALYVVNALSYFRQLRERIPKPQFVAGHSLGEYNALLAADVFDYATGLRLVKKRGELMAQTQGGGMAAIIGLSIEQIQSVLQAHTLTDIVIANYNSNSQTVISGPKPSVVAAQPLFEQAGGMVIMLNVSGAFHSPQMRQVTEEFSQFLALFHFNSPSIPVIANVDAKSYPIEQHEIKNKLALQIMSSVRWKDIIEYLLAQGEQEFEEIGPGQVLTGLIKRIRNGQ